MPIYRAKPGNPASILIYGYGTFLNWFITTYSLKKKHTRIQLFIAIQYHENIFAFQIPHKVVLCS